MIGPLSRGRKSSPLQLESIVDESILKGKQSDRSQVLLQQHASSFQELPRESSPRLPKLLPKRKEIPVPPHRLPFQKPDPKDRAKPFGSQSTIDLGGGSGQGSSLVATRE